MLERRPITQAVSKRRRMLTLYIVFCVYLFVIIWATWPVLTEVFSEIEAGQRR